MPLPPCDRGTFDKLQQKLIDTVNPFDIMPSLTGVFTSQDIQMLTQKTKDHGNRFGMMELLNTYGNKAKNLEPLFNALKQANYTIEGFCQGTQTEKTANVVPKGVESFTVSELKEQIKLIQEEMKGMQVELGHVKSAKDGERARKEIDLLRKDLKNMQEKLEQQESTEITRRCEIALVRAVAAVITTSFLKSITLKSLLSSVIFFPFGPFILPFGYSKAPSVTIGTINFPSKSILLVGGRSGANYNYRTEVYCTEDANKSSLLPCRAKPRQGHVGCKIGPKIVLSGGEYEGYCDKSTDFFDIPRGQWSAGPETREERRYAMSAAISETFFVFGGRTWSRSSMTRAVKLGISSTDRKWQSIKDLPTAFFGGNAIAVDDQIYIIGNKTQWLLFSGDMSSLIYVPAYDQYLTTIPAMGETKHSFASTLLNNNAIVVTGGYDDGNLNTCNMLDIRTKKWEVLTEMNVARSHHQLVNVNDKLYAIGGRGGDDDQYLKSVEMFDIRNKKWIYMHPIKLKRGDFTAFAM